MSKSSECTHADNDYCIHCSKHFAEPLTKLEAHKHGYDCGFQDGFEEAVRLLRSEEAGKEYLECDYCWMPAQWASWLESKKNDAQGS